MRLVVAIGGNALLRHGQVLSAENQLENIRIAASQLSRVATANELVLTHGNGPQVGLLALQTAAYDDIHHYSLDVLGAETDGMLGYLIEQELSNALPAPRKVATLLSRVEARSCATHQQRSPWSPCPDPPSPCCSDAVSVMPCARTPWCPSDQRAPSATDVEHALTAPQSQFSPYVLELVLLSLVPRVVGTLEYAKEKTLSASGHSP